MNEANHKVPAKDNQLAIASLVLGIVSLCGAGILTGIPAIITGVMGLKNPIGKGMSVAGIILGCLSVVVTLLFVVVLIVIFSLANATSIEPGPNYSDQQRFKSSVERNI